MPSFQSETWQKGTVKPASELTAPTSSVPYFLLTGASFVAVDAGVDEILTEGVNVVPVADIRGASVAGDRRDAGACEFNGTLSIVGENKSGNDVKAYPNPFTDVIRLGAEVQTAEVFDMAGVCRAKISCTPVINRGGTGCRLLCVADGRRKRYGTYTENTKIIFRL